MQYKHGTQHSLSDLEILKSHCHWLFHSFVFQCKIKTARFEWYIVDPNQALTWNPQLTKSLNDDHLLAPFCPRNPLVRRQRKLQKKLSLVLHSRVFLKRLGVCTWHGTQMIEMMILIHPFFFPTWVGSFGMWILDGGFCNPLHYQRGTQPNPTFPFRNFRVVVLEFLFGLTFRVIAREAFLTPNLNRDITSQHGTQDGGVTGLAFQRCFENIGLGTLHGTRRRVACLKNGRDDMKKTRPVEALPFFNNPNMIQVWNPIVPKKLVRRTSRRTQKLIWMALPNL